MCTRDLTLRTCGSSIPSLLPLRGVLIAVLVVGLGLFLIQPIRHGVTPGDFSILIVLVVTAILGHSASRRLVHARESQSAAANGCWMTIIVGPQGPTETSTTISRPKAPPRNDPERRSLARRARERNLSGDRARR